MEGHCEPITDYTDKSTFETEKPMLTSIFLNNSLFGNKSFRLCKSIREKRCIFTTINRNFYFNYFSLAKLETSN